MPRAASPLLLLFAAAALQSSPAAAGPPSASSGGESWHSRWWRQQQDNFFLNHGHRLALWPPHANSAKNLPPKGAIYVGVMNMPVIGRQTFALRILGRNSAQIILIGRLNLDEPATFQAEPLSDDAARSSSSSSSGGGSDSGSGGSGSIGKRVVNMLIDFNRPTLELLSNWKTRITRCTYDADEDYATITISPPLVPSIRVKMRRTSIDPRSG